MINKAQVSFFGSTVQYWSDFRKREVIWNIFLVLEPNVKSFYRSNNGICIFFGFTLRTRVAGLRMKSMGARPKLLNNNVLWQAFIGNLKLVMQLRLQTSTSKSVWVERITPIYVHIKERQGHAWLWLVDKLDGRPLLIQGPIDWWLRRNVLGTGNRPLETRTCWNSIVVPNHYCAVQWCCTSWQII